MAGPEKLVEDKIKRALEDKGYWFMKVWGGSGVKKGVPDIISVINGHFVSWEIKRNDGKGRITPVQKQNAVEITQNGGIAVFISDLHTFKVIEDHLLHPKKKFNLDDSALLHLDDEPHSAYEKGLYEGIWR